MHQPIATPIAGRRGPLRTILGKYREIILSIVLFILLDLGVLVLNFYISFQIQGDAVALNLSGRQRMLSQRTTKSLYQLRAAQGTGNNAAPLLEELTKSFELFDSTLQAFAQGGVVTGGDGKAVAVPAVKDGAARKPLDEALAIWADYREKIRAVLEDPAKRDPAALDEAIAAADAHNLEVLKLMNDLTTALEHIAEGKASFLRQIQTVAIVLVLINFAVIMIHVIGKLGRSDQAVAEHAAELEATNGQLAETNAQLGSAIEQLESTNAELEATSAQLYMAKQETDTIFATVRQGIFLLDANGAIGAQTSAELKAIFQTAELGDRQFLHLLRPLLPEKNYQTVADYLSLLFDPRKNDKQLQRFNPLKRVELHFQAPEGGFQSKHIEFSFQRISYGAGVARVLVTAADVTERVKLEEQLRLGEEKQEKQFEMLFELLPVEGGKLRQFLDEAASTVERSNGIFMEPARPDHEGAGLVQDKVQRVFRLMHHIKSQAAFLGLALFEKSAHRIEDKLGALRRNPETANEDLLPVLVSISAFQTELEEASELITKIAGLRRSFAPSEPQLPALTPVHPVALAPSPSAASALKSVIEDLSRTVLSRSGKQARLEWQLEDWETLPPQHQRAVKDALVQLVRNAIVHGIEAPRERAQTGKDPCGSILIEVRRIDGGRTSIRCRDDGAGLDGKRILERAVAAGMVSPASAAALTPDEVCGLIFSPGFSTAEEVTLDAGRGVGLDALQAEIVDQLDGEITIAFVAGQFCEFGILLPSAA